MLRRKPNIIRLVREPGPWMPSRKPVRDMLEVRSSRRPMLLLCSGGDMPRRNGLSFWDRLGTSVHGLRHERPALLSGRESLPSRVAMFFRRGYRRILYLPFRRRHGRGPHLLSYTSLARLPLDLTATPKPDNTFEVALAGELIKGLT
jgi:hypothetical protein